MGQEPAGPAPGSDGHSPKPAAAARCPGKRAFRGEPGVLLEASSSTAVRAPSTPTQDSPLGLSDEQQVTEEQQAKGSEAGTGGEEHTPPPTPQLCQFPLQFQAS